MPAMDTRHWRRLGYIPLVDAAKAVDMWPSALRRFVDKGRIPYQMQGRYKYLSVSGMISWVRSHFTDESLARRHVAALKEAARIRNDWGAT